MISDVKNYPISVLFDIESKVIYNIPRYQREYTWAKWNWESLFDDIIESDTAYFLGSIICINQTKDVLDIQALELVDGQQRMTTLSLLFLALYSCIKEHDAELDDDQRVELANLKNRLIIKKTEIMRINPQHQNDNNKDYSNLIADFLLGKKTSKPKNAGNRRIFKCFKYFKNRFEEHVKEEVNKLEALIKLLEKFMTATLVKIQVESHADAYTLFESLNNRGVPLTPIDIIKNKLLAELEKIKPESVDQSFDTWQQLLDFLGDDYAIQERFFRQYYNGFKAELSSIIDVPVATKSNLIRIYEKLIHQDPEAFLSRIIEVGKYTALILSRSKDDDLRDEMAEILGLIKNLERIQGVPSYLMLMHLFYYRTKYELNQDHFKVILNQQISFFVRRSVTDFPPTYDLTRLFMGIVDKINKSFDPENTPLKGSTLQSFVMSHLAQASASDEIFEQRLKGPIYEENTWATRYILCAIEESTMTKETWKDLWKNDSKLYVWTIEHIFPQGEKIPMAWVDMIAKGDSVKAKEIQESHVHKLGNLTISGFNSSLGNKSFIDKRDRIQDGKPVGYKNGLSLNAELSIAQSWDSKQIDDRTELLVKKALGLFKILNG